MKKRTMKIFKKKKVSRGFTLLELIITVMILLILGTIAYLSFVGYSKSSRDAVRLADTNFAVKALELYKQKTGKYPLPDTVTEITYSGGLAWSQGLFGNDVTRSLGSLNKTIKDPLYDVLYSYSTISNQNEYQIAHIIEGDLSYNHTNISQANAASYISRITGDYNEKFVKVDLGSQKVLVAAPSIILSDTQQAENTEMKTMDPGNYVYHNTTNIPASYKDVLVGTSLTGSFNFPTNEVVYTGSIFPKKDITSDDQILSFMQDLKSTYQSSQLASDKEYEIMMINESTGALVSIGKYYLFGEDFDTRIVYTSQDQIPDTPDTIPDAFIFTDQMDVERNTLIISNTHTLSGTNTGTTISIINGEYSINGGSYTSTTGSILPDSIFNVRLTSSGGYLTTSSAILTIGGISDSFDITTEGTTPVTVTFTNGDENITCAYCD